MSTTTTCALGHPLRRRADGRQRCTTCDHPGARAQRLGRHPLETLLKVPNAPFRERFAAMSERGDITAADLARALGWERRPSASDRRRGKTGPRPDTQRVMRTLGLVDSHDCTGASRREVIGYEVAVAMLGPLDMEPHEGNV